MVLDEPLHCALSVMTLIALAGPRGPRTGPETAAESELPTTGINRALRDLTAARLLTVELEAACIGYAATKPPSAVMIAGIIEVAHAPCRRQLAEREEGARDKGLRGEPPPALAGDRAKGTPAERARHGLMVVLGGITLSKVLHAQVRHVGL